MRYTFKIISTEEIGDDDGIIPVNCILYSEDDDDSTHATARDAFDAAYHIRDGLSGSRGYDRALETSRVLAFEVDGDGVPDVRAMSELRSPAMSPGHKKESANGS